MLYVPYALTFNLKQSKSRTCDLTINPFLILINPPPLIINNKSGNPKMPHEHFKRGCTNFKRSKTIMT